MKTKPKDTPYCGCSLSKIVDAEPVLHEESLKYLHSFISKRYRIHKKKDVYKLSKPWTEDEVLKNFRFTNVRREHDRETLWLLEQVTHSESLSYQQKIYNTILFRLFNKHETLERLLPIDSGTFEPEDLRQVFDSMREDNPKAVFFTNAFYTTGMKMGLAKNEGCDDTDYCMVILKFIKLAMNDGLAKKLHQSRQQKDVIKLLCEYSGIGGFMSYQIFVDLTYLDKFPFSENEFTVAGPGCRKGLDYLFTDRADMSYEEALFWLRDNIDDLFLQRGWNWKPNKLFNDLQPSDRHLNVMSLENCFCELSKYIRAKTNTGRPKNKYQG